MAKKRAVGTSVIAVVALSVLLVLVPTAGAVPITKLPGTAGCVADTGSSVPAGTCTAARGIGDATDVAISPDGKFAYAAATSSNSIAIFSRDSGTGELTQLPGTAGCIAWDNGGGPLIPGCASGSGLEGPSALAMSPDGKNIYVTGFQLDPGASPTPKIQGTLTTFSRDGASGVLTQLSGATVASSAASTRSLRR